MWPAWHPDMSSIHQVWNVVEKKLRLLRLWEISLWWKLDSKGLHIYMKGCSKINGREDRLLLRKLMFSLDGVSEWVAKVIARFTCYRSPLWCSEWQLSFSLGEVEQDLSWIWVFFLIPCEIWIRTFFFGYYRIILTFLLPRFCPGSS